MCSILVKVFDVVSPHVWTSVAVFKVLKSIKYSAAQLGLNKDETIPPTGR